MQLGKVILLIVFAVELIFAGGNVEDIRLHKKSIFFSAINKKHSCSLLLLLYSAEYKFSLQDDVRRVAPPPWKERQGKKGEFRYF